MVEMTCSALKCVVVMCSSVYACDVQMTYRIPTPHCSSDGVNGIV